MLTVSALLVRELACKAHQNYTINVRVNVLPFARHSKLASVIREYFICSLMDANSGQEPKCSQSAIDQKICNLLDLIIVILIRKTL